MFTNGPYSAGPRVERLRAGIPLKDRKEHYEQDNLGALRLASKGCAIDPATSQSDCPQFCELSPQGTT